MGGLGFSNGQNVSHLLGNTVVAAVSFVCRLGLGSSRGVFKD